ncbi:MULTISPECIES: hypothetical protein [unclassified Streptomyces]|uniref:hypothetical protein n=1 Tax=unclassified Streptomyces TaxID=2593676 RepID=UPI003406108B
MTITPGLESDPYAHSPAARNADLPEGLKSPSAVPDPSKDIENPHYPALGFNPVPGNCDTVSSLHRKLVSCAKVLDDTHATVTKLMDGSYWAGDAAVAWREQLQDGPLAKNLRNAANSIGKAARQLDRWHGELEDFQARAKRLNAEAKDARDALRSARGGADAAAEDPGLKAGKAAGHEDAKKALKALSRADARVEEAEAELERILGRARRLAYEHEEKAGRRASKIRTATAKLAPHEPGWFEDTMEWIKENLPDILSTVAAVVGLVALFVVSGGTAAAVLLLVGAGLSAGSLTLRLTQSPEMLASLRDGFTKGEFDQDFWSNFVTAGGDVLGLIPGIAAAGKGAMSTVRAVGEAGEALTLGQRMAAMGATTMNEAKGITRLDNSLLAVTVRGARAEPVIKTVQTTSVSLGAATAAFGLGMKMADADEDGVKGSSVTGIDGARLAVDGGGILDVARHVFH